MAEGFARVYGSDVIAAVSAGLSPAVSIAPLTRTVMREKNIDIGDAFPKGLDFAMRQGVDLIINMSGQKLPGKAFVQVEDWEVRDPIGLSEDIYRTVRDQIEQRVMRLILAIRAQRTIPVDTRRHPRRQ
jgi:arsenate reductase (thioredoxin)